MNAQAKNDPLPDEEQDMTEDAAEAEVGAVDETIMEAVEHRGEADDVNDPLAEAEAEKAVLNEKLLRALAEMDNLRKRLAREKEDASKYAVASFARDLVGVMENLVRAAESIPAELRAENKTVEMLAQGVALTLEDFKKSFAAQGIERVNPQPGEKFDHHFHQAVTQVETPGQDPGTIVQVVQAGYRIHDRLLRPAMVVVAKAPDHNLNTTA